MRFREPWSGDGCERLLSIVVLTGRLGLEAGGWGLDNPPPTSIAGPGAARPPTLQSAAPSHSQPSYNGANFNPE
jgi:hypothetical protein